ncbi:MAG: hypothetical protein ACKN9S_12945 [Pirellula sp.]
MKWNIFVGSMVLGACLSGQSFGGDLIHRLLGGNGVGAKSSCCDTSVVDPSCGAEMAGCGRGPSCGTEIAAPACDPCAGAGAGIGAGKAGCGLLGKRGPSCGSEIAASDACAGNNGGVVGPSCGVETAGCAPAPVCRTPVLDGLKGLKCKLHAAHVDNMNRIHNAAANLHSRLAAKHACKVTAPSCGAEVAGPSCGAEIAGGCGAGPSCGAEIAGGCGKGGLLGRGPSCGAELAASDPCSGAAAGCDSGFGAAKRSCGLLGKIFKSKSSCDAAACDSGCSSCGSAPAAAPAAAPAPVVDPHAYLNTNRGIIQASSTRVR